MSKSYRQKAEGNLAELGIGLGIILVVGTWGVSATVLDAGNTKQGLIAEYRFDTGAGNTAYDTAGDNNGNINGASWSRGVKRGALNLEDSDSVNVGRLPLAKTDIGFSVWINPEMPSDKREIIIESSADARFFPGYRLALENGNPKLDIKGVDGNSLSIVGEESIEGGWQHLSGTVNRSSGEGRIYLNGRDITTGVSGSIPESESIDSGKETRLGVQTDGGHYYTGKLDEFYVFSDYISETQARSLYNSGSWRIGTTTEEDDPSKVLDIPFQHQNSSHVFDTSGYENHAQTKSGIPQEGAVKCKVGRCYKFNGVNQQVEAPDDPVLDISDNLTLMAWINTDTLTDEHNILTKGDRGGASHAYGLLQNGDSILFQITTNNDDTQSLNSEPVLTDDKWIHTTGVWTGSAMKIYVDGKLEAITSKTGDLDQEAIPLQIGRNAYGGDPRWFDGHIDQAKIFNRSLSQSEIVEKTEGLDSQGAVLDLQFNRDGGDIAEDSSSSSNDARILTGGGTKPERVKGVDGNALRLEGDGDAVDIPSSDSIEEALSGEEATIAFWVDLGEISGSFKTWFPWTATNNAGSQSARLEHEGDGDNIYTRWIVDPAEAGFRESDGGVWARGLPDMTGKRFLHVSTFDTTESGYEVRTYINDEIARETTSNEKAVLAEASSIGLFRPSQVPSAVDKLQIYPYSVSPERVETMYQKGKSLQGSPDSPRTSLVLDQTFDRVEECGQKDTLSCPSGASGKISVDESGEANHAELVDGPEHLSSSDCRVSNCFRFDGGDGFLELSSGDELDVTNLTVSVWANFNELPNQGVENHRILQTGSYNLDVRDNGPNTVQYQLIPVSGGQNREQVRVAPDGDGWVHILGTFDNSSGDLNLYFNGEQVASRNLGEQLASTNPSVRIGGNAGGNRVMNGTLDQLRVYDRKLQTDEIWKLYTQGRDRSTSTNGPMKHFTGSANLQSVTDRVGKDGTLGSTKSRESNDPDVTSGYVGTSLEFDGSSNEYVEVENPVDPTKTSESMSVSFWLKPSSKPGEATLVEWEGGAHVWQSRSEDDFYFNPTGTCSNREATGAIKLDQWAHYTVLYDAPDDEFRWYVDGDLVKTASESCEIDTSSDKLRLGKRIGDGDSLDGKLDEVKIYPYALSTDQVQEEANAGVRADGSGYDVPRSCREIHAAKDTDVSSTYTIDPDGRSGAPPFPVFCEMEKNGGGWTKLNFLPDSHKGNKGAPFGSSSRYGAGFNFGESQDPSQANLGLTDSQYDPVKGGDYSFFQKDSDQRCTKWAVGNASTDNFKGVTTGWDYYDSNGNPIAAQQVAALSKKARQGTYYNGRVAVSDIDGPFPNGGDGDGGENSFSIPVDPSATHSPNGGGPIALWFSTDPDLDAGTTHVLGSDHDSNEGIPIFEADWKPVNTEGVPMFFGGKVDDDANLYSEFSDSDGNDCESQHGSEFELENQFFYAK